MGASVPEGHRIGRWQGAGCGRCRWAIALGFPWIPWPAHARTDGRPCQVVPSGADLPDEQPFPGESLPNLPEHLRQLVRGWLAHALKDLSSWKEPSDRARVAVDVLDI